MTVLDTAQRVSVPSGPQPSARESDSRDPTGEGARALGDEITKAVEGAVNAIWPGATNLKVDWDTLAPIAGTLGGLAALVSYMKQVM